ncbi:MAG: riboflavin synthase [Planctomycetota bacterium]
MFTGIVEAMAEVKAVKQGAGSARIVLDLGEVHEGVRIGDSIAVNGVCLTVVTIDGRRAAFDVITETLKLTSLGGLKVGGKANVERSMRADGRFHGHVVSGHVDGTGEVSTTREEAGQTWFSVRCGRELTRSMIHKGSITIDGVSLTLTEVTADGFSVALIPHTLAVTTLGQRKVGTGYPLRSTAIEAGGVAELQLGGLDLEALRRAGFGGA